MKRSTSPNKPTNIPTSADDEKDEIDAGRPNPAPAPSSQPAAGDARDDPEKLKQNREHLNVDDKHKTPEMEKGHRGTFP
ncbi:MAG TPA: hypothetical protein VJ576_20420 [Rhodocyclaceae bacterium]|nr:hypothetical protein [Rhodocyclaceae bacterium]